MSGPMQPQKILTPMRCCQLGWLVIATHGGDVDDSNVRRPASVQKEKWERDGMIGRGRPGIRFGKRTFSIESCQALD